MPHPQGEAVSDEASLGHVCRPASALARHRRQLTDAAHVKTPPATRAIPAQHPVPRQLEAHGPHPASMAWRPASGNKQCSQRAASRPRSLQIVAAQEGCVPSMWRQQAHAFRVGRGLSAEARPAGRGLVAVLSCLRLAGCSNSNRGVKGCVGQATSAEHQGVC